MSVESQNEPDPQAPSVTQPTSLNSQLSEPSVSQPSAVNPGASGLKISQLSPPPERVEFPKLLLALVLVLASATVLALHVQSFFDDPKFRGVMISAGMRDYVRTMLPQESDRIAQPKLSLPNLFGAVVATCVGVWLFGASLLALVSWSSWRVMLWKWALRFLWLCVLGLFEALWAFAGDSPRENQNRWLPTLLAVLPFFHSVAWGGLIASAFGLMVSPDRETWVRRTLAHASVVWIAAAVYAVIFSALSVLQYRALMVPHGDTAMYEEHLWNLLHGKGFRSQLDGGRLFFGEHLEVIHVLLLPVYVLFPSLPTLNICLTIGLASGAIAVRGITRRLTRSDGAANWLAVAYLLYFPLQYLNLEVSLKTFRPENFGVPLLLFAIWSLEANRLRTMLVLFGLTLLCKEDYAIPVAMLGLFLAVRRDSEFCTRNTRLLGLGILAFAVVFLWFVLDVFIPHFRGEPPHYMAYYPELGKTPLEIVANVLRNPSALGKPLLQGGNLIFVLLLIVPLVGLPLAGLGRLWVLMPTLGSILLIQLDDARSPFFHFHAPLVPVLIWSAAEGTARLGRWFGSGELRIEYRGSRIDKPTPSEVHADCPQSSDRNPPSSILHPQSSLARFAVACALVSGVWAGKSPLSLAFYDPSMDTRGFGRVLYIQTGMHLERVQAFERLFPLIPQDASVAATDFVRPRFTHHRECHQYGEGGLKPHVNPESIDYIVVDLTGPYSDWFQGQRLRELEEAPDRWEVLHWDPIGELFFRVIRAKRGAGDIIEHSESNEPVGPANGDQRGTEGEVETGRDLSERERP